MKKTMVFLLGLSMIFSLAACGDNNALEADENTEPLPPTETIVQSEYAQPTVTAYIPTEADDFEKYGLEYDLDENDIGIIRNFYTQIADNYMSIQNSNTEQHTRNPIDIYRITMIYFGEKPIIGCHYMYVASEQYDDSYEFALAFEMDDQGSLTETSFDVLNYVSENTGKFGMTDGNIVITYVQIGTPTVGYTVPLEEKDKIKYTMAMYSNYKKLRQEKYGDIYISSGSYQDKLDENQRKLFNNILNTENEWDYYYNSWESKNDPCIYIRVWSFGDGTAEILCTHGTVDAHDLSTGQVAYSGSNHGYYIDSESASELDNQAQQRLENDLRNANKLYWSPEWAENVKKDKLAEFILNL